MKKTNFGKAASSASPNASIVTPLIGTGLMVFAGQWVKEDKVSVKTFVGLGILLIFMSVLQDVNIKLAQQFAWLIFLTALFMYGVPVGQKIAGIDKTKTPQPLPRPKGAR